MGYSMKITKAYWCLPDQAQEKAFQIWKSIFFDSPSPRHVWYGFFADQSPVDWSAFLHMLGFACHIDEQGIRLTGFEGKLYEQKQIFMKIAHLVPAGCHIAWQGEDKERWAWFFDGQSLHDCTHREIKKMQLTLKLENSLPPKAKLSKPKV